MSFERYALMVFFSHSNPTSLYPFVWSYELFLLNVKTIAATEDQTEDCLKTIAATKVLETEELL